MSKKLPLTDFRVQRSVLEPHEFALSDGENPPPTDPIDEEPWNGIVHLPDDVAIRTSDHNGSKLKLLYQLWGDWIEAVGNPEHQDELYSCMLDAVDCFQSANFDLLHGYYRSAIANLRAALELVMIGAFGNHARSDQGYVEWKNGMSDWFGFTMARRSLRAVLAGHPGQSILADDALPARTFKELCAYTHSRPNASDGAIWESNGPVYSNRGMALSFRLALRVYAICYLLVRIGRPDSNVPQGSRLLYELKWLEDYAECTQAHALLYP